MIASGASGTSSFSVLIVGGGIAGATCAHALALRGCHITVLERSQVAQGASGNPAGVLFPQFAKRPSLSTDWHLTSYQFMLAQLERWRGMGYQFDSAECGMVRLPRIPEEEGQLRALNQTLNISPELVHWVEADRASGYLGVPITQGGLYFPRGSWVATHELCRALLSHPCITVVPETEVTALARHGRQWQAKTATGQDYMADHCVIATAHEGNRLLPDITLRLHGVGGQISTFTARDVAAPLGAILCYKGYIIPMGDRYVIGATYNHGPDAAAVTDANHAKNIADVEHILPGWIQGAPLSGRTRLRATTPDRLPYAGQIDEGLWINVGHGSRGLLSAPLAGELMAAAMCGAPPPFNPAFMDALSPRRFG